MSRLFVKNLPAKCTEEKLQKAFQKFGSVTDCILKFSKDGTFRRFGFVGYQSEDEAQNALANMNKSYMGQTRIEVEMAVKSLSEKPKRRGRHSFAAAEKDSSTAEKAPELQTKKHMNAPVKTLPKASAEASSQKQKPKPTCFALKMRRLSGKYDKKKIMEFFKPLVPVTVKLPRNARHRLIGVAYVTFKDEKDLEQALRRNKSYINEKRVLLKKDAGASDADVDFDMAKPRPWEAKEKINPDTISDTGRLFLRNLAYCCTEDALEALFKPFGVLTEVNLPFDKVENRARGYAFITFMKPEDAVKAFMALDGTDFQGRLLHILPGKEKVDKSEEPLTFKEKKKKLLAGSARNWNTLFIGTSAVTELVAKSHGMAKTELIDAKGDESLAVKLALGEADIVKETRKFLLDNGVALDSFSQAAGENSKTTLLARNLPANTPEAKLREHFGRFGELLRVVVPPTGHAALVEFAQPTDARTAFNKTIARPFLGQPLYVYWAPVNAFSRPAEVKPKDRKPEKEKEEKKKDTEEEEESSDEAAEDEDDSDSSESEDEAQERESEDAKATIFVKNLNFHTTDEALEKKFKACGGIVSARVVKKQNRHKPGKLLSAGYGFVTFTSKASADKALRELQHCMLDGHKLELSRSQTTAKVSENEVKRKRQVKKKQGDCTKILVRNVPFQANKKEITQIFSKFGTLNFVRLPKKITGSGEHRGFAFVDFATKESAKEAFRALCHSTHLYGRRLVLEWADAAETVQDLQRKTASKFSEGGPRKKLKRADILNSIE